MHTPHWYSSYEKDTTVTELSTDRMHMVLYSHQINPTEREMKVPIAIIEARNPIKFRSRSTSKDRKAHLKQFEYTEMCNNVGRIRFDLDWNSTRTDFNTTAPMKAH
mmetsp:Transcript_25988/g.37274  ORF Transcript_25988/g.37274 Transcript_25988/m.37274 type:complete len:106 (-) Transcript_25988:1760-2077(-)